MDDALLVLLLPMGRYVVFFLPPFLLGAPSVNYHDVIGIIINVISIIFITYILNFDTIFSFIPSCMVFGCVFGICCSCDIHCIRYAILVLRQVVTRLIISFIFLISIGCIISVDINYFCRLVLWHINLLDVVSDGNSRQWGRGGTLYTISIRSAIYNNGIGTGTSGHGVVIFHLLICGCSICLF